MAERVQTALGAIAVASFRRPFGVLTLLLLLVLAASGVASKLALSADLAQLLPKTFQSVQDLETLRHRVGGIGYIAVIARGAPPERLREFADAAAERLRRLEGVRYVDHRRPSEFFKERGLYFMEVSDLETLEDRIVARKEWELAQRNPLYLGIDDSDPPSVDFSDLRKKYEKKASVASQVRNDESYYLNPEDRAVAIFVKPDSLSADLAFARRVVTAVENAIRGMDLERYGDDFRVGFTGSYKRRVEQQDLITRDLRTASLVAALAVLAFLALYFRRLFAIVLIIVPLIIGLSWTFAFAYLAFEKLNILTGFLGAILLGLGIDHGIHLLTRYEAEAGSGAGAEAVRRAFSSTGRAAGVAALTTIVAFTGLAVSEFRAFHEFGMIAAFGMAFILGAYVLTMPALLSAVPARLRTSASSRGRLEWYRPIIGRPKRFVVASLVLFGVLLANSARVEFDYDFRSVQGSQLPSFRLDAEVTELLGRSQSPVVIPTDSIEEEREVARALRQRQKELGDESTIDFVLAISDLVPARQKRKQPILEEIGDAISQVKKEWLDGEQKDQLAELRKMVRPEPFDREDLPREVTRQFQGPEASPEHGVVLVFPSVEQNEGLEVRRLARELRVIELPGGRRLQPAAEAMILADILEMVIRESPTVLAITLVAVLIVLVLLLARLADAVTCVGAGALTVALTLGALPLAGVELNYLNILVIPVLFGLGVDGAVHMVVRRRSGASLPEAIGETGRGVFGSILTTALGFGALMLAAHDGLQSIGHFAVLGLAMNALVTLVALPAWLAWRAADSAQNSPPLSSA